MLAKSNGIVASHILRPLFVKQSVHVGLPTLCELTCLSAVPNNAAIGYFSVKTIVFSTNESWRSVNVSPLLRLCGVVSHFGFFRKNTTNWSFNKDDWSLNKLHPVIWNNLLS